MSGVVYCQLSVSGICSLYLCIALTFALLLRQEHTAARISPNFLFARSVHLASVLCLLWLNACKRDSKAGIYLPGTF
jgi:hypothetical protein